REWSWEEMLGTLRELDDAVGADASNLERAEYVLGVARRAASSVPPAGSVSWADPVGGPADPGVGWLSATGRPSGRDRSPIPEEPILFEAGGPVNRPELARDAPAWAEWGRWDWELWDDLTATWDGFLALRQAAEQLAEDDGRETSGVGTAIDRADTGSLAAALLLVEQPLLGPVVRRLVARVEREYVNPQGEWRSRRAYGEVLGRLHEGIAALAECGVDEGELRALLWRMARMVAEDHGRFPYFADIIAGTVMRLGTLDGDWAEYQRVLVHAMSTTDCRGLFLREYGRLRLAELGISP
ncbi:hypothetical protein ACFXMF_44845, partial [Embleya sp. NPDC059213]|uniref:hypothetical protein n=2 Tax=Embleya TaxID=2699295 RepID=UPI0036BA609B